MRPHSINSIENATPLKSIQPLKCDPIQRHVPISVLLGSTPPPPRGCLRPLKPGNIVAETLREMFLQQFFRVCVVKKHLLRQQNVSEKVHKHILLLQRKKCFPQQILLVRANGETLGKQCPLNYVSSFSEAFT